MIIKDCHVHAGGKNYSTDNLGNESNINDYCAFLSANNIELKESVFFGQPYPYDYLIKFDNCAIPCINYGKINDIIAKECKTKESCLFSPIIDERDYNAADELKRCKDLYEIRAIKVHSEAVNGRPLMLKHNGIIDFASKYSIPIIIHANPLFFDELRLVIKANENVNFIIAHLAFLDNKGLITADNAYFDTSGIIHENFKKCVAANYLSGIISQRFSDSISISFPKLALSSFMDKVNNFNSLSSNVSLNLEKIISSAADKLGSGHILFGSDYAWSNPLEQIKIIESGNISLPDKENIFYKNFDKLFN
jgi:predicted TIM-barrel fold metal-dependent hydrolase